MACLDFTGRTIVISGAANGIGLSIAEAFAAHGASLELIDRDPGALTAAVQRLEHEADILSHSVDLTDSKQINALADDLKRRQISIHALINNAGIEYATALDDTAPEAEQRWQDLLHNNVSSMYLLTRALTPLIHESGSVINQSSIWGLSGVADFSAYVTSKHAVIGLTRSLAWELGRHKIRVNAVCPGWVATDAAMRSLRAMAKIESKPESQMLNEILAQQAIPELLNPEDIAVTFLFLASPHAFAITGQAIVVSNGEVMH